MDDGVVVMVDGRVKVLHRGGHRDVEVLRRLLDERPDLVLGSTTPDDHLGLLLVTRQVSDDGTAPTERVYVDADGVPVLVGVRGGPRAAADSGALLRLLDRVALELPRWREGRLREQARSTHDGRDEADLLRRALDWSGEPADFWQLVGTHVARSHVRVVLVADRLTEEVTRVVELLDHQLRDVEVRAVEVALYGSGDVTALVPRSTRTAPSGSRARHAAPADHASTGADLDDALRGLLDPVGSTTPGRHRLHGSD